MRESAALWPGSAVREVSLRSADGLRLRAYWHPGGDRAAVLLHGKRGSGRSEAVVATARVYAGAGFGVLVPDLRGRGGSEGRFLTAGYQEERDVRGALRWLAERGFEARRVVLHGWSAGGAAALRAAPGAGVGAVVEDSAFAELPLLLGDLFPGPPRLLCGAARLVSRVLGTEFDPWALCPREDAARLYGEGVPLLIIHCRGDRVVPFRHAELLAAAHPAADFWEVADGFHGGAYAHPGYRERLLGFVERALGPGGG